MDHVEQGSTPAEIEAPPGYPKLAERMGLIPEIGIFRSFGSLNALCILYMQAELMDIEQKLRRSQVRDDKAIEGDKWQYARDWHFLKESLTRNGDDEQLQLTPRFCGRTKSHK
ncbi:hypothetical protein SLS58_004596 [Diplodia intermedia]|uniref:DUF6594 domain-containing protein n=1 Tax=Diplodia intermedia TaxID=856260 RepID=A0ABR3TT35_9PEZI